MRIHYIEYMFFHSVAAKAAKTEVIDRNLRKEFNKLKTKTFADSADRKAQFASFKELWKQSEDISISSEDISTLRAQRKAEAEE